MANESARVLEVVKAALRARRITYRTLAERLAMSESGVKKLFANGDCSLDRLLAICDAIGVSFEEIAQAAGAAREPAAFTPAQEDFFLANPQCFHFLYELITHHFDLRAVAAAHGLDDRTCRIYVTALAAQHCIRVLANGEIRDAGGFAFGIALDSRLARRMSWQLQDAVLHAARATPKPRDGSSFASLGMARMRIRRDTARELCRSIHERDRELWRRARAEALTARPEVCVEVGLLTAMAPLSLADVVSLATPNITRARRARH